MSNHQERLYGQVNSRFADHLQIRPARRAVVLAMIASIAGVALAFAVAVFAFFMSALAPRMLLAWNLEDGSGQQ